MYEDLHEMYYHSGSWPGQEAWGRVEMSLNCIKRVQKMVVWWRLRGGRGCRLGATQPAFGCCLYTWRWCTSTLVLGTSCALCNVNGNWAAFISSLRRVTRFLVNFTGSHAAALRLCSASRAEVLRLLGEMVASRNPGCWSSVSWHDISAVQWKAMSAKRCSIWMHVFVP